MKRITLLLTILIVAAAHIIAQDHVLDWAVATTGGNSSNPNTECVVLDNSGNILTTGWFESMMDFDPGPATYNLSTVSNSIFVQKLDNSGNFIWARQIGDGGSARPEGIAVDQFGDMYVTGYFTGTVDFDPEAGVSNLTSAGSWDIFVVKLSASGSFGWAKAIGGTSAESAYSIDVDNANNVYVVAYYGGIYIEKLDASGNLVWTKNYAVNATPFASGIDGSNNLYVTGLFNSSPDFDPGAGVATLSDLGNGDAFVQKLDQNGDFVWVKGVHGTKRIIGHDVSTDNSGNVYLTGFFEGTPDFDPGAGTYSLTSTYDRDAFIEKLDASGNFVWARAIGGGSTNVWGSTVRADASGNVYTVGFYQGNLVDFDPGAGTFYLNNTSNGWTHKLDASGNFVWVKDMVGNGPGEGSYLAIDASANLYIAEEYVNNKDFDPNDGFFYINRGDKSTYVQKLQPCTNTSSTINVTACNSYSVPSGNQTHTFSGSYLDTISNAIGCDSVITINLTILNDSYNTFSAQACGTYTAPSGGTYTSSGSYNDTIPNSAGCDSIMTINLTIKNDSYYSFADQACATYTAPSGAVYTSSSIYNDTIPNAAGCDSIMTINLTINNDSYSTLTNQVCNTYTAPSGMVYTMSGTYNDTIPNVAGCDSILTINLTIYTDSYFTFSDQACNTYIAPSGAVYNLSGIYNDTITNNAGCDSIMTINLTINNNSSYTFSDQACSSYTAPSGAVYTSSGTFNDTIPNNAGCDSILTINLTISGSSDVEVTITSDNTVACFGTNIVFTATSTNEGTLPFYQWMVNNSVVDTGTGLSSISGNDLLGGDVISCVLTSNASCLTSNTDTSNLITLEDLVASLIVNDSVLCSEDTLNLQSEFTGMDFYSWKVDTQIVDTGANSSISIVSTFSSSDTAIWELIVTKEGCLDTAYQQIIHAVPQVDLGLSPQYPCEGDTLIIDAGAGYSSYEWDVFGQTTQSIEVTTTGNYWVTVTDQNGCTGGSNPVFISYVDVPLTPSEISDVSCNGLSDGSINLFYDSLDQFSPVNFVWSNGSTGNTVNGLSAGDYIVTAMDNRGCISLDTFTVSEPTAISLSTSTIDASCGQSDGMATVSASNGAGNYSYLWSNGNTTSTALGLSAGSYSVTVTDDDGCTASTTVSLSDAGAPSVSIDFVEDLGCNGAADGSIDISVTGGTVPYTYNWSNGSSTQDLNGLIAGTYLITVLDSNNCSATANATVNEPDEIVIVGTSGNSSCGNADGTAAVIVTGGSGNYSYLWSNGATTVSVSGLVAGSYTVVVSDDSGCSESAEVTVSDGTAPTLTAVVSDASCYDSNDGSVDLTVSGGTGPYFFNWSNNQSQQNIQNLLPGDYTVSVVDSSGCIVSETFTVSSPDPIVINVTVSNSSCGSFNGSAVVTATGGDNNYTYSWSNGDAGNHVVGLAAGTYVVTVTDGIGCTNSKSVSISDVGAPLISATITDVSCNGEANGAINVTVSGGVGPYEYSWTNNNTNQDIDNLEAGDYSVIITDDSGCSVSQTFTVNQPDVLSLNSGSTPASCGGSDGSATVVVSGGTPSYTYTWTQGQNTATVNNLSAGLYFVNVEDANGCENNAIVSVSEAGAPILGIQSMDISCNGQSDGSATVIASAGIPPFNYEWKDENDNVIGITESINNLSEGTYTISVSNTTGCQASANKVVTIIEPENLTLAVTTIESSCGESDGEATVHVSGGTGPYSYLWDNGDTNQTAVTLSKDSYSVVVTDEEGCLSSISATVEESVERQTICLVTVDDVSGGNTIVWEKDSLTNSIIAYKIYRETTTANVYDVIGTVDVNMLSTFTDSMANSQQKADRYKITGVDSCGNESALSGHHKTIHLSVSEGVGQKINLQWNHYEGFAFGTYYIYRSTSNGQSLQLYDSIQSNNDSYTDLDPPSQASNLQYQVVIFKENPCSATGKRQAFASANSNIATFISTGLNRKATLEKGNQNAFVIYPNPNNGVFTIAINPSWLGGGIVVYNTIGEVVEIRSADQRLLTFDLKHLQNQVVLIKMKSKIGQVIRKVIIYN